MALARELARLKHTSGAVNRSSEVSSVLFDRKDAGRTPLEDLAALGAHGVLQLSKLDRRFLEHEGVLFSGNVVDRFLLDKDQELAVEKAVNKFCLLVSPFFLLRPAQKCIEWLLQGWSCAEFPQDVEALLLCALPYHETPQGVALLHALLGNGNRHKTILAHWMALRAYARARKIVPRHVIASLPASLMHAIALTARRATKANVNATSLSSLYVSVVCERVTDGRNNSAESIREIFVDAVEGLCTKFGRASNPDEFKVACLLIISAIATRTSSGSFGSIGVEAFQAAGEATARIIAANSLENIDSNRLTASATFALLTLCASTTLEELPENVFHVLVTCKGLGGVLSGQKKKHGSVVDPLASSFGIAASTHAHQSETHLAMLDDFIRTAPLQKSVVVQMIANFLDRSCEDSPSQEAADATWDKRGAVVAFLRKLARSNLVSEMDAGVQKFLRAEERDGREEIFSCIREAFVQTKLQTVVPSSTGGADGRNEGDPEGKKQTSLLTSLEHPLAELRLEGVRALNNLKEGSISTDFVQDALLRRLVDDDPDVQLEALKSAGLRRVQIANDVLNSVDRMLLFASGSPSKVSKRLIEASMQLVADFANDKCVGSGGLHESDQSKDAAVGILLRYLVEPRSDKHLRKFQKPAIEALKSLDQGDLGVFRSALAGMPRPKESKEKDVAYSPKVLATTIGTAVQSSKQALACILRAIEEQAEGQRPSSRTEQSQWWWMWLAHKISVANPDDKSASSVAMRYALEHLECSPISHRDSQEEVDVNNMKHLDLAFSKASRGVAKSLDVACGISFLAVAKQRKSKVEDDERGRQILLQRAYRVFIRNGLWSLAQALLRPDVLATDRHLFLRNSMFSQDSKGRGAVTESLGVLAADAITTLNGKDALGEEIVADIVAFAASPARSGRLSAVKTASYLLQKQVDSKSERKSFLEALVAAQDDITASAKSFEEFMASPKVARLQSVVVLLITEACQTRFPKRSELLFRACCRTELEEGRMPDVLVPLADVLKQDDDQLHGARSSALLLLTPALLSLLERSDRACCERIVAWAEGCKKASLQKTSLEVLARFFGGMSKGLRSSFFAALCHAVNGKGTPDGALRASELALTLSGIEANDFLSAIGHLQSRPSGQSGANHMTPKRQRKAASARENSTTLEHAPLHTQASALAALELLQKEDAPSAVSRAQDLIRPLLDLVETVARNGETQEGGEEEVEEGDQTDLPYAAQLALSACRNILRHAPEEASLVQSTDIKTLVTIVGGEDVVSLSISQAALALLRVVTELSPGSVGPEMLEAVSRLLETFRGRGSRSNLLSALRALLGPLQHTSMEPERVLDTVARSLNQFDSAAERVAVLEEAIRALGISRSLDVALRTVLSAQVESGLDVEEACALVSKFSCDEQLQALNAYFRDAALLANSDLRSRSLHFLDSLLLSYPFLNAMNVAMAEDEDRISEGLTDLLQILFHLKANSRDVDATENDTADVKEANGSLEGLVALLPSAPFSRMLTGFLTHESETFQRFALEIIVQRLDLTELFQASKRSGDLRTFDELPGRLVAILQRESCSSELRLFTMSVLDKLCARCGRSGHEGFQPVLNPIVDAARSRDVSISGSALLCLATFFSRLGTSATGIAPAALSVVADNFRACCSGDVEMRAEDRRNLLSSCLVALKALLHAFPQFMGGDAFHEILSSITSARAAENPQSLSLLMELARRCQPRFLLPALAVVLSQKFAAVHGDESREAIGSMVRLLEALRVFVEGADKVIVRSHRLDVLAILLRAMEVRRRLRLKSGLAVRELVETAERVDAAAQEGLIRLALRLREVEFKDTYLKLLEWSEGSGRSLDASSRGKTALLKYLDRTVPTTRCVYTLLVQLQSIFAPYFLNVMDRSLELLLSGAASVRKFREGTPQKQKKQGGSLRKRKRASAGDAEGGDLHGDEALLEVEMQLSMLNTCRALERFFSLDDSAMTEMMFEKAVTALLAYMESGAGDDDEARNEAIAEAVAACGARGLSSADSMEDGRRRLATVNKLVLVKTRAKSRALRLCALQCVQRLAQRLGDEYLATLPETMTFLAELLEDEEETVVTATKAFVTMLEELSGESILEQLTE